MKQEFDPKAATRVEIAAFGRTNQHSVLVWLSHADYAHLINSSLMKKKNIRWKCGAATQQSAPLSNSC